MRGYFINHNSETALLYIKETEEKSSLLLSK